MHFFNFDHLRITLQSSDLIWGINSVPLFSLSLHSSYHTFKLLFMASYGGELVLDSSSPWSGISNHLSSFSIPLPLIFKTQRTPLMKKIQGLQAIHGATSGWLSVLAWGRVEILGGGGPLCDLRRDTWNIGWIFESTSKWTVKFLGELRITRCNGNWLVRTKTNIN